MATKEKSVEEQYQILSEIEHIRARAGMYVGATTPETNKQWLFDVGTKKMVQREINTIPAFIKIFSEILDNSIDEHKRSPADLTAIKVDIDKETGTVTVYDNGRGFPCEIHPKSEKYVVETVFTNLRAGSNFDDSQDQSLIGTNGLGAKLCVILSTKFSVETADGKKLYKQSYLNGMSEIKPPKITESDKHYTKITFSPDYEYFKMSGLDDDHYDRMVKRVVDAAACNPAVKFYINGERIAIKDFDDYIEMYIDETGEFVYDSSPDWKVGISKSTEGFEQVSFVNAVETYQGGEHVKYVINQIVEGVRTFIKKKHKVECTPGDIRNHMRLYISCNINRPRFSSQTKENMVSTVSEWKTSWTCPDKFINKLVKTEVIQSILDWAQAKADANLKAELRKVNKDQNKINPSRVEKFSDANTKERHKAILYLAEGDSAGKSIQGGRGSNPYIGSFPLKGKIMNVFDRDVTKVLGLDKKAKDKDKESKSEPNEIQKIMTILGLTLGEPVEFIDVPDGEWFEISIDGRKMHVNEHDTITVDGEKIKVSSLL